MDLTVVFKTRPAAASEVMQHSRPDGREFHFTRDMESMMVRLGPYDNSDFIEIKELDNGEVAVLHDHSGETECVLSVLPEEV